MRQQTERLNLVDDKDVIILQLNINHTKKFYVRALYNRINQMERWIPETENREYFNNYIIELRKQGYKEKTDCYYLNERVFF